MNAKDRAECATQLAQACVLQRLVKQKCDAVIETINQSYGVVNDPKCVSLIRAFIHDRPEAVKSSAELMDVIAGVLTTVDEVDELDG